jgi:hypothetical protein
VSAGELIAWRDLAGRGAQHGSEVTSRNNILLQTRQDTEVAVGMTSPSEIVSTLERRVVKFQSHSTV